mmetsp:Transcript_78345/g.227317  ORF Transcript_78345/g.227317 Transcript_78345/m.227317 type:complete len:258 (-) Transcript_78345:254-1027(-)
MMPKKAVSTKFLMPIVAIKVPIKPTPYAMEKGSLSRCITEDMKADGPFKIAKELSNVVDPKAKSRANFCGAITSTGRKENDMDIRKMPTRKTPPNWASFAGESVNAVKPCKFSPAFSTAPFAKLPAAAARSFAALACAAPSAFASFSFSCPLPPSSFASFCASLLLSDTAAKPWEVAEVALSATRPMFLETSFCQPFACSANSKDFAFSPSCDAVWLTDSRTLLKPAFAQPWNSPSWLCPRSRSPPVSADSACGTTS